jgi:hypothetical protein
VKVRISKPPRSMATTLHSGSPTRDLKTMLHSIRQNMRTKKHIGKLPKTLELAIYKHEDHITQ